VLHHVQKNHPLFDSYSLYKKSKIKIHGENECSYIEQDKNFHLSGILSYQMNYNFFNEYENKIELVSTKEIWKFKEQNRFVQPKFEGVDPIQEIEKKCKSILTYGFLEPLQLINV
jgi:folate-dependent tRNA-U54 methylase TrmFO/GidA